MPNTTTDTDALAMETAQLLREKNARIGYAKMSRYTAVCHIMNKHRLGRPKKLMQEVLGKVDRAHAKLRSAEKKEKRELGPLPKRVPYPSNRAPTTTWIEKSQPEEKD